MPSPVSLKIVAPNFAKIDRKFKKLQRVQGVGIGKSLKKVTDDYADNVRGRYRRGAVGTPLKESTLQQRSQGKRAGVWKTSNAEVPKARRRKPLNRTRGFADLVKVEKRSGGKTPSFRVTIDGRARSTKPGKKISSKKLAAINEFGATIIVRIPPHARFYLRALAAGVAGTSRKMTGLRPDQMQTITAVVMIRPRPVWRPALMKTLGTAPSTFGKKYNKIMREQTGLDILFTAS